MNGMLAGAGGDLQNEPGWWEHTRQHGEDRIAVTLGRGRAQAGIGCCLGIGGRLPELGLAHYPLTNLSPGPSRWGHVPL